MLSQLGQGGCYWHAVEKVRDVAERPTRLRAAPPNKKFPSPNPSGAEGEGPGSLGRGNHAGSQDEARLWQGLGWGAREIGALSSGGSRLQTLGQHPERHQQQTSSPETRTKPLTSECCREEEIRGKGQAHGCPRSLTSLRSLSGKHSSTHLQRHSHCCQFPGSRQR